VAKESELCALFCRHNERPETRRPTTSNKPTNQQTNPTPTKQNHNSRLRHDKHWRYVSQHTVAYWAQSYVTDLVRFTRGHAAMKCYGLGLGLDTFR
jgi:hypothetical protein